jgi:pyrimidine oxygenase
MSRLDIAEYGIFLPIGNGGWIISETAPHPEASYDYNRKAARLAEDHGLDFIMSMAKWRGYDGTTDHWGRTLESMTMMAGLAEATSRVKVWATVHTLLFHPAVVAKMFATLDQISGGRSGMNIVTGAYPDEFAQMGLWPEHLDHDARYRYTEEWLQVVLRLWTEDSVTHRGEFFHLEDCRSRPHPSVRPDLVCAGRSGVGLDFTTTYCDAAFVSGRDRAELREATSGVRERAAARGRTVKTYSMLTVVMDETDAAAEARVARYQAGVDMEAITNMARSYGVAWDGTLSGMAAKPAANQGFQTDRVVGAPDTVVEQIEEVLDGGDLDGLMLIFPDFHADLDAFGQLVMPRLRAGRAVAAT